MSQFYVGKLDLEVLLTSSSVFMTRTMMNVTLDEYSDYGFDMYSVLLDYLHP